MTGDEGNILSTLNSPGGVLGAIASIVAGAAVMFRKYWLTDKVASANAEGQVDLLARMSAALDKAEARADAAEARTERLVAEANARADLAYKERNDAVQKIGELTEQVRSLKSEVQELRRNVNGQ